MQKIMNNWKTIILIISVVSFLGAMPAISNASHFLS
jgi:hypothetical protein